MNCSNMKYFRMYYYLEIGPCFFPACYFYNPKWPHLQRDREGEHVFSKKCVVHVLFMSLWEWHQLTFTFSSVPKVIPLWSSVLTFPKMGLDIKCFAEGHPHCPGSCHPAKWQYSHSGPSWFHREGDCGGQNSELTLTEGYFHSHLIYFHRGSPVRGADIPGVRIPVHPWMFRIGYKSDPSGSCEEMDAGYVSSLQSRRIPSRLKATCVNRWCPAPQTHSHEFACTWKKGRVNKHRWNG